MPNLFEKQDILNLSEQKLTDWFKTNKIALYHLKQIKKWIYIQNSKSFYEMTDISKKVRELLEKNFRIGSLEKSKIRKSKDGSKKYLFKLEDSNLIESVLIPEKDHYTLCISSQAGCAQRCRFCQTAKLGFIRNLSKAEIISQILDIKTDLKKKQQLTNIVFMGMGEPLANLSNVISALNTITDSNTGLGFSKRRVTVSTCGIASNLKKFAQNTEARLAVSLNAADNKTRDMLMPINKKYPIETLIYACKNYPLKSRDRITFEYVLLKNINDSEKDAIKLIKLLNGVKGKVNLIPFNKYLQSEFEASEPGTILQFQKILSDNNITAIIRNSKGSDISAACGQLAVSSSAETGRNTLL
ncbi:MAG: 23S rRNA (adenine(2503)-C(2))-methyltransferase RlmN [Deltaproteobacteria bacterium]|nr:23S rRNA (adenine(2503)-C(2))-methyltransferase RlmN [Deltaproteobacteria bacterium]